MKKYQWVPGTLVFCSTLNLVGCVTDSDGDQGLIEDLEGEEKEVNITDCRYATEDEAKTFETAENAENLEVNEPLAEEKAAS